MKRFMLQLAVSVPLAIAMGCGSDGSDGPNGPKECLGVCTPVDNDASGSTDTAVPQSGTVVAMAPDGLTGDFYFGNTLTCEASASCEASVEGMVEIEFKCPKHLFLPKSAVGDPAKDQQIVWTDPGDWGLAPSGTYLDEQDKFEGQVKTWLENSEILLDFDGTVIGKVNGNKFSWTSNGGTKYSGTIADDLRTISYHVTASNGNEADAVLTLVE